MKALNTKEKSSRYSTRFFRKLLLYFFTFSIPILVIIVLTWWGGTKVLTREFQGRIQSNITSAAATIDIYLDSTRNIGIQFFSDDTIVNYFQPRRTQSLEVKAEQWRIPRELNRTENIASGYMDHLYVFFEEDDVVFTSSGTIDKSLFFTKTLVYEGYPQEFWENSPSGRSSFKILAPSEVTGSWATSKETIPVVSRGRSGGANAVMVANLSTSYIKALLEGTAVVDSSKQFIVNDEGIIYSSSPEDNEAVFALAQNQLTAGVTEIKLDGVNYLLAHAPSGSANWIYFTAVPLKSLRQAASFYSNITTIACILLLFASFFLAYRYSLQLYRPIARTMELLIQGESGLINPTADGEYLDDLDFLKSGIERLSFRQLQSQQKSDMYSSGYVEHTFRLLIEGILPPSQDTFKNILTHTHLFTNPHFACLVFRFDFHSLFYDEILDTARIEVFAKLGVVLQMMIGDVCPCYVMEPLSSSYLAIVNQPTATFDFAPLFARLEKLFTHDLIYFDLSIGVGESVDQVEQLGTSYNQAMSALLQKDSEQTFSTHYFQAELVGERYVYTIHDQKMLLNTLKTLNYQRTEQVVTVILEEHEKTVSHHQQSQRLFRQMIGTGTEFLNQSGKSISDLSPNEFIEAQLEGRKTTKHPKEDRKQLLAFFGEAIEVVSAHQVNTADTLVDDITKYVEANYTKDLGLEQIADELGVSMKYLSRVFKQNKGVNLSEYINHLRIEYAKEMLVTTNDRIGDIAPMVGIQNRTTFIRVFKRHTGITPNEYRQIFRKDEKK